MTFTEALSAVFNEGDRVTRADWNSQSVYLEMDSESTRLCIHGGLNVKTGKPDTDNLLHPYILVEQDYFADDWEIVDG